MTMGNLYSRDFIVSRKPTHIHITQICFPGDGHQIVQQIRQITVDHGLADGASDPAVFYQEAVLCHTGEFTVDAGLSAGESADDKAFFDLPDHIFAGSVPILYDDGAVR